MVGGSIQVRRLTPTDTDKYRALMLVAYEVHPDAFTSSVAERAAKPRNWWAARLDSAPLADEIVCGALAGGSLVGVAGISFETREKARHKATVFGMYVDQTARGAGVGQKLLIAALAYARMRDHVRLAKLTVTQGNAAAQRLYARNGFRQFGLEPYAVAVGDAFVSKVHMWCDLRAGDSAR